jgi:hypothetical protein
MTYRQDASYGPAAVGMTYGQDNDMMILSNEFDTLSYGDELLAIDFQHDTTVAIRASLDGSSTTHNVNGKHRKQLKSRHRVRDCTSPENKGDLKSPS